jgi:hypothetical protein
LAMISGPIPTGSPMVTSRRGGWTSCGIGQIDELVLQPELGARRSPRPARRSARWHGGRRPGRPRRSRATDGPAARRSRRSGRRPRRRRWRPRNSPGRRRCTRPGAAGAGHRPGSTVGARPRRLRRSAASRSRWWLRLRADEAQVLLAKAAVRLPAQPRAHWALLPSSAWASSGRW